MTKQILAWEVSGGAAVTRLQDTSPDYEEHLEDWIAQDPDILDSDFLVVDRQVLTEYGGYLDLLGINSEGILLFAN
jgi:RecB family endonuclease NucS